MTLTTHALVGAAVAQLFPAQPYLAFAAGFASHFAIDAIPHWDYGDLLPSFNRAANPLETDMAIGAQFFRDLAYIAGDALLGLVLSIFIFSFSIFHTALPIVVIGVFAALLPDALQFVYYKTRSVILLPLQRFHIWLQHGTSPLPIAPWLGLSYQALLVGVRVVLEKFFII